VAAILAVLLFAAGAPSPLYVVYQAEWGFSSITLTAVFAAYVAALLVALVFAGSLSDHVGRRPVLVVALGVEVVAMLAFALADGVGWLFAARLLQGLATGLATGALSAALLDLDRPDRPGRGALVSSAAPSLGLALGALGSGALVQWGPDPMRLVFWLLLGSFVLAVVGVLAIEEPVRERGEWRSSGVPKAARESRGREGRNGRRGGPPLALFRPHVAVPPVARPTFIALAPCFVAVWALAGLYLSLGPSLVRALLGTTSHVAGGLVIATLMGASTVALVVARRVEARPAMVGGAGLLVVGVAITLVGLDDGSTALVFVGSAAAGLGFGPAFAGAFRTLAALAPPAERAGLIAAVFVVSYTAFSVPAVIAGLAITQGASLQDTADVYGLAVIALAAAAAVVTVRRGGAQESHPAPEIHPCPGTVAPCPERVGAR
jgi:MFS family permease